MPQTRSHSNRLSLPIAVYESLNDEGKPQDVWYGYPMSYHYAMACPMLLMTKRPERMLSLSGRIITILGDVAEIFENNDENNELLADWNRWLDGLAQAHFFLDGKIELNGKCYYDSDKFGKIVEDNRAHHARTGRWA